MALPEPLLLDEELENQCNEIRAIASKNWLSSAHSSLQHLDQIKTSVYNVGIHDPKDLKATNLSHRGQRSQSYTDLANTPNGPPVSLQKNAIAWGSNGSIPDLLAQHSARSQMSEKPSVRRTRPSSGKKSRPQSAKELHNAKGSQLPPRGPSIGVKGARVDPAGRPPKTVHYTSTGWVGPPAGLKFADDLPTDISCGRISLGGSPPPAPAGSPIPPEMKLGPSSVDDYHIEENEVINTEPPKLASPEPIHFSLPRMEEDYEEDSDLDTERLLAKAEEHAPTPVVTENLPGFTYTHNTSNKPNAGHLEVNGQDDVALPSRILKEEVDNNSLSNDVNTVSDDSDDLFEEDDDSLEDDWDEELAELDQKDSSFNEKNEKTSVKFREDKNVTIDITPRNLGYKVADMETHSRKKRISPQMKGELESVLSILSTGPPKNGISLTEVNQDTKHSVERKYSQQSCEISKKPKPLNSALKQRPVYDTKCEKRLTHERPRSANKPSTPVTTVTVAYSDMEEIKKSSKSKGSKKHSEKEVITMVERVLSDSEEESVPEADKEDITPDKLESWMPTKCVSEPPKNYYELSRRSTSVQSHFRELSPKTSNHMYKTTKTIEFDEYKPKETTIKNVIDASALLKSRDRERFVGLDEENRVKARPSSERPHHVAPKERLTNRPSSEMSQKIKSSQNPELPVGKLGAVATHLDKVKSVEKKMLRRPLSATHSQRKSEVSLQKEECIDTLKGTVNEKVNLSHGPKPELSEREREIENLINKHLRRNDAATPGCKPEDRMLPEPDASDKKMTENLKSSKMDEAKETEAISHDQEEGAEVKERPPSGSKAKTASRKTKKNYEDIETLVSGTYKPTLKSESLKENKVNKIVLKMAETRVNAKLTDNTKHYASYSRSRVRSAPLRRVASEPKVRYTKPFFINSKNPDDDVFTENELEAHQLHQRLAAADVFIRPETLERALYPPSGKTLYYDVENKLPRSTSASLLSHPKVWLPVEYKQFKLAEKNLDRANEIIRRRELAEERKARLAELGSAAKKKKGKKKGGKKKGAGSGKNKSIC